LVSDGIAKTTVEPDFTAVESVKHRWSLTKQVTAKKAKRLIT